MRILIIGGGAVGTALAKKLAFEKHEITIVDRSPAICASLRETLDVAVICGSGAHPSVLEEAGINGTEMLIAASGTDEVNLVACMIAEQNGVRRKIARIRSAEFYANQSTETSKKYFSVDLFIRPEDEVTAEVSRLLLRSFASEIIDFENGRVILTCLRVDENFADAGRPMREIGNEEFRRYMRVLAIRRPERTLIPGGDDTIEKGDLIFVSTVAEHLKPILRFFGKTEKKLHKIMILGATGMGIEIADRLAACGLKVKLLDRDRELCTAAAARLPKVDVMHCAKSEIDTMALGGIMDSDAFVAMSDDEENNILLSLIARHLGVGRTIALVNRTIYQPFMRSIGIETTVNLELSTAGAIMRFVRKGDIVSIASFHGIEAEAIEMQIPADHELAGKVLRELAMPQGSVLAAIIRGKETLIPYGETVFKGGDRVIVFAMPQAIEEIERLFS